MCKRSPRKIKSRTYNLYDLLLNGYALGPFIFYIGSVICNSYFFFIPNHSDKFQHCFKQLGHETNITENDLNVLSMMSISDNILAMTNILITNFVIIYMSRRKLVRDKNHARIWIILVQYYYALKWISEGWLSVDIAATRPLQTCVSPKSPIFRVRPVFPFRLKSFIACEYGDCFTQLASVGNVQSRFWSKIS